MRDSRIGRLRLSRGSPPALNISQRGCSGGGHSGRACCRDRRAAGDIEEVARPLADARLADGSVANRHGWVADSLSYGGDFSLGVVLSVVGMSARCRSGVLLFRSHIHDGWLRRSGAGEAVAGACTDRGFDGRPYVRLVRGYFFRGREPPLSVALREHYRRLEYRKDRTMKTTRRLATAPSGRRNGGGSWITCAGCRSRARTNYPRSRSMIAPQRLGRSRWGDRLR